MKVIVNGAAGHMGGITINLVQGGCCGAELAAAVDVNAVGDTMIKSLDRFDGTADVIVDFSHHTAIKPLLAWAVEHNMAVVAATTGYDDGEKAAIAAAAEKIPVFWSSNMSMGIAFLADTARRAAALFPDADIEIVEMHHNRKVDAPSGTALMLAEAVLEERPGGRIVTGRSGMGKREKGDIGVAALRMGNLPGTHEVMITTQTQSITLKHEVFDRTLLAEGALQAAEFVYSKAPGLYGMADLVK